MLENIDIAKFQEYLPAALTIAGRVVGALVFALIAIIGAGYLRKIAIKGMNKSRIDVTLSKFVGNLVKYAVIVIAGVSILGMFGVQTASFAALIAAMGLAIGLAFQGTLGNIASGLMLLLFRPYKVGDFVRAGGETGTVNEIELFTTSIDTPDKRRIIVPNSAIFGSTIENVSFHPTRRCDVAVGTSYDADLEKTKAILMQVLKDNARVLADPAPQVVLTGLGDSTIEWSLRPFVKNR